MPAARADTVTITIIIIVVVVVISRTLINGRELYWFNSGLIPGKMAGVYQGGLIGAY